MKSKGQLFLIEVIIALSVMIVLVTALFSIQSFSPLSPTNNLQQRGSDIIEGMEESGLLFKYFEEANYSKYNLGIPIFDNSNQTKIDVISSISSGIPLIVNFKAFTDRYNDTRQEWEQIDIINFEVNLPTGSEIVSVEYYTPGINGVFAQFKFTLYLWFEVEA